MASEEIAMRVSGDDLFNGRIQMPSRIVGEVQQVTNPTTYILQTYDHFNITIHIDEGTCEHVRGDIIEVVVEPMEDSGFIELIFNKMAYDLPTYSRYMTLAKTNPDFFMP